MALAADDQHLVFEQPRLGRGVGGVAVDAAGFVHQRPVQAVFAEGGVDHLVVTPLAEFET